MSGCHPFCSSCWGLLVLEPQGPLSPAGHPIAQLVLALLMYGVVVIWLWGNRSTDMQRRQ
jgi:hypothetical protein